MADERSPLLGQVHHGETDYSAVNEPEQGDSVSIRESTDAEQQQTVGAPQNSILTLVRLVNFCHYLFNTALGQR